MKKGWTRHEQHTRGSLCVATVADTHTHTHLIVEHGHGGLAACRVSLSPIASCWRSALLCDHHHQECNKETTDTLVRIIRECAHTDVDQHDRRVYSINSKCRGNKGKNKKKKEGDFDVRVISEW